MSVAEPHSLVEVKARPNDRVGLPARVQSLLPSKALEALCLI
jgi:hypothetical protein